MDFYTILDQVIDLLRSRQHDLDRKGLAPVHRLPIAAQAQAEGRSVAGLPRVLRRSCGAGSAVLDRVGGTRIGRVRTRRRRRR